MDDDAGSDERLDQEPPRVAEEPRGPTVPNWVFALVPAVLVALLVGAVAIAARGGGDDGEERISGAAAGLPSVAAAAEALLGTAAGEIPADPAPDIGRRAGEITVGLIEISDEVDFAAQFDRLPPDEARLLGRSLGSIQRELSPSDVGGPRGDSDREDDTVFALDLVWAAAQVVDPSADPMQQAFNVLPAAVPLADNGDDIAAAVVAGDMRSAAQLLEPVLSDAGAAEVVSGLAGDISDRLGARNDDQRLREFQDAYRLQIP